MYTTGMIDHHARWKERADELSHTLKLSMILGEYFIQHYRGHYYGKAQNLSRKLPAAYDAALYQYDLLLMPTTKQQFIAAPTPSSKRRIGKSYSLVPEDAHGLCLAGHCVMRASIHAPPGNAPIAYASRGSR